MDLTIVRDTKICRLKKDDLVLVTGASGFIGRELVKLLVAKGYQVRALSRQKYCEETSSSIAESNWIVGDICNADIVGTACNGVSAVFHLAGVAHVGSTDKEQIEKTNVLGTAVVKDASTKAGVLQLIYFSSVLADEPDTSAYAKSKLDAENILLGDVNTFSRNALRITILRAASVYGAGMKGNIAGLIKFIEMRRMPPLPSLQNRLALISVKDLNRAAILAAVGPQKSGEVYTLTDGESYTPSRIEAAIYSALGRKKPRCHMPRALFFLAALSAQIFNRVGIWKNDLGLRTYLNLVQDKPRNSEKVALELGFKPSITLETALMLNTKSTE